MRWIRYPFLALVALSILAGCAKQKALFVLLPDLDGNVGTMEVITEGGSQVITRAEEAITITDPKLPPAAPQPMSPMELLETFKDVWQARPDEPTHFLVYFDPGTSDLTADSRGLIGEILETISDKRSSSISVIGHADTQGPKEMNAQLSFERAIKVRDILVLEGVETSYLEISSHGEEDQLVKTADEVPEPLNRRVEIIVR